MWQGRPPLINLTHESTIQTALMITSISATNELAEVAWRGLLFFFPGKTARRRWPDMRILLQWYDKYSYAKEVQIVYRLFLVNCYLPTAWKHICRVKQKQIGTKIFTIYVGGLVIHWTGLTVHSDDSKQPMNYFNFLSVYVVEKWWYTCGFLHVCEFPNSITSYIHSTTTLLGIWIVYKMSLLGSKGQVISEWIFGVWNFPKKQRKNLKNFCPKHLKSGIIKKVKTFDYIC